MKRILQTLSIVFLAVSIQSCVTEEDLDVTPEFSLSEENVEIEQLVIAAYSALDYRYNTGDFRDLWPFDHAPSNWGTCDIRSGDAYKGGGGTGDNPGGGMQQLETHDIFPSSENVYNLWRSIYFGLNRINTALRTIDGLEAGAFENAEVRRGELKVLRAHFYFEAMKNFGSAVLYDENTPIAEIASIPNTFDEVAIWSFIEADLNDAIAVLPDSQADLGRASKMVAHAYLAKAHLFQREWNEVITNCDAVINSGQYRLVEDIERLYSEPGYGNQENIFAIQFSISDGSQFGNLNFGDLLNSPDSPGDDVNHPYLNGDDFHKPSQNLANAYKVGANGLPLFNSFNATDLTMDDVVDPRLDHVIGRPGITWKDWQAQPQQENWSRDIQTYGLYVRKKNMIYPSSPFRSNPGGFPWAQGALDFPIIKYSDLILWKAEASIENGDIETARQIINEVRLRAKNSPTVKDFNNPSQDAANYLVEPYPQAGWSAGVAMDALRFERRLELANEGHRFYDLVRWGIASDYLNTYIAEERGKRTYLAGAVFTTPEEYLPIPQIEIDASSGVLVQRPGY